MDRPPIELSNRFAAAKQDHVFAGWDVIDHGERELLIEQLQSIDVQELERLYQDRDATYTLPPHDRILPLPDVLPAGEDAEARVIGERALAAGEVAALVVAGGQGSRLGFEHPKGMFPIGPVSGCSLFQIHAEKVFARSRRHGKSIPFLVMTSHATHAETVYFFERHNFFGLDRADTPFFLQGTMPALDIATGRLLMEHPGRLFLSPDGHGGTLTALASSGLLAQLAERGIKHIFYFQVDNPLVKIVDPTFLGQHIRARADVSNKVITKDGPHDKLGNFVLIDGRLSMIEYSDLPDDLARQTNSDGRLRIRAGNPAIHIFDVGFLQRVTGTGLPFHVAKKKVPYWDPATGDVVEPKDVNALKFERFIFDVLPLAKRYAAVETPRSEEFAPLKNATGADSPESVKRAISDLAARWLRTTGARVPTDQLLEIGPLTALEPTDLSGLARTPLTEK